MVDETDFDNGRSSKLLKFVHKYTKFYDSDDDNSLENNEVGEINDNSGAELMNACRTFSKEIESITVQLDCIYCRVGHKLYKLLPNSATRVRNKFEDITGKLN